MPCACVKCLDHSRTLGLAESPESKDAVRKAFHAAAKLWHPDLFENDPAQRLDAEEKFKTIQAAYTALLEHVESPVELPAVEFEAVADPFPASRRPEPPPSLSFGGAPGCYTAQDFSSRVLEIVWSHIREPDRALALVDISRHGSPLGDLSQYILLSRLGIVVRDAQRIISLLWYDDLGEMRFGTGAGTASLASGSDGWKTWPAPSTSTRLRSAAATERCSSPLQTRRMTV